MSSAVKIVRIVDPALSRDMFEFSLAVVLAQMKNLSTYLGDKGSNGILSDISGINEVTVAVLGLGRSVLTRQILCGAWVQSKWVC